MATVVTTVVYTDPDGGYSTHPGTRRPPYPLPGYHPTTHCTVAYPAHAPTETPSRVNNANNREISAKEVLLLTTVCVQTDTCTVSGLVVSGPAPCWWFLVRHRVGVFCHFVNA